MSGWAGRPGRYDVGASASVRSLALEAEAAGTTAYVLPVVGTKKDLLAALRSTLRFPSWAGANWDAAADLLTDLGWLPDGPVTLIWPEPEALAEVDPAAHRTALEVLGYAARHNRQRPLTVVVAHRGPH